VIWDESVWEKPESQQLEGLCAVRSSKAKRLTHYKKGYYSPPPKPIFVPGLQWIGLLLVGRSAQQGPPLLAAMRWWSSRGGQASFKRDEEAKLLLTCAAQWGRRVVHIFDQGFAGGLWLGLLVALGLRFVLRWRKDYQLIDAQGNKRKAWHIARGKRGSGERWLWDSRRARWVQESRAGAAGVPSRAAGGRFVLGRLSQRGTLTLVFVDQRSGDLRGRGLAGGLCLCPELPH